MLIVLSILKIVCTIILLGILCICVWETGKYFTELKDEDKYKPLIAWDFVLLLLGMIAVVLKIVM